VDYQVLLRYEERDAGLRGRNGAAPRSAGCPADPLGGSVTSGEARLGRAPGGRWWEAAARPLLARPSRRGGARSGEMLTAAKRYRKINAIK